MSYEKEDLRVKLENAQANLASATQVPAGFDTGGSGYVAFPELEEMGITTRHARR